MNSSILSRVKTAAIIPAFNESTHISDVINGMKKYVDSVIVVDDGSSDGTGEVAKKLGAIVMKKLLLILVITFKGVVKTFKRNPVVAIFCIIFLFPIMLNLFSHYMSANS